MDSPKEVVPDGHKEQKPDVPHDDKPKTNLLQDRVLCAHCKGTGSCNSAKEGTSCVTCCTKKAKKQTESVFYGVVCSVCDGNGYTEPMDTVTTFGVLIALLLCVAAMFLIYKSLGQTYLDKVLPVSAAIISSITGYFFGARAKSGKK